MPRSRVVPSTDLSSLREDFEAIQARASGHLPNTESAVSAFYKWVSGVEEAEVEKHQHVIVGLYTSGRWRNRSESATAKRRRATRAPPGQSSATANPGLNGRSAQNEHQILTELGVTAYNAGAIFAKLQLSRFRNGLCQIAKAEEFMREKKYPKPREMLKLCQARAEDSAMDSELRAFWYMLVATGNRPANVFTIIKIDCRDDCLAISWSARKVSGARRGIVLYPYCWSGPPTAEVRATLRGYNRRRSSSARAVPTGWRLHVKGDAQGEAPARYNVAATMCAWLLKQETAEPWTSTTPRDVLATSLLPRIGPRNKWCRSPEMYFTLLDHHEHTAYSHYISGEGSEGRPGA